MPLSISNMLPYTAYLQYSSIYALSSQIRVNPSIKKSKAALRNKIKRLQDMYIHMYIRYLLCVFIMRIKFFFLVRFSTI